jgi:hypothetical protein
MNWIRRHWKGLTTLILVLLVVRLAAPTFIVKYANRKLNELPDYHGHIHSVTLHILRAAYQLHDVRLVKRDGQKFIPFFSCDTAEFALQKSALLHGKIAGEINVISPRVNFVNSPKPEEKQTKISSKWQDVVKGLMPIDINRFTIEDGRVHFHDLTRNPPVNIYIKDIEAEADNLKNKRTKGKKLFSPVHVTATAMNSGKVVLNMQVDALAEPIAFKLNGQLTGLKMTELNPFFKAYGSFDVKKGIFSMYTEVATENDKIVGYVKPMFKDVDVADWNQDKKQGLFHYLWESIVGTTLDVVKNQPKDRDAAKIPFEGTLDKTNVDVWGTIGSVLQNAFVRSLVPGVENSVTLADTRKVKKK